MRVAAGLSRSLRLSTRATQSCVPKPSPLEPCPRTGPEGVWGVPQHTASLSRAQPALPLARGGGLPASHTQGRPCPCASGRVQRDWEALPVRSDPRGSRLPPRQSAKPHPQR